MSPVRAEDKLPSYRVALATDQKAEPALITTTKNLQLQPAQEALSHETQSAQFFKLISGFSLGFVGTGILFFLGRAIINRS